MTIGSRKANNVCFVLLAVVFFSSCASVSFTRKTTFDQAAATAAITDLKEEPLVIVLPTEGRKIKLLSTSGRRNEATEIKEKIDELNKIITGAFESHFTFTDVLFMPDTLVNDYENGNNQKVFITDSGILDESPLNLGNRPYKVILYDYVAFEVVTGNSLINHPFPNRFAVSVEPPEGRPFIDKLLSWEFGEINNENINSTVQKMNLYFNLFYADPSKKYYEVRDDLK